MNAANHIRYRLWVDSAIDINSHSGVLIAAIPYHATLIGANGLMSVLLFFTRNDRTYLHQMINTSKNIWTNGVECGKICIGAQSRCFAQRMTV